MPVPCVLPAMEWLGRGSAGQGTAELGAAGQGTKGLWVPGRREQERQDEKGLVWPVLLI